MGISWYEWGRENLTSLPGFEPQTLQPIASCCTEYANPASDQIIYIDQKTTALS